MGRRAKCLCTAVQGSPGSLVHRVEPRERDQLSAAVAAASSRPEEDFTLAAGAGANSARSSGGENSGDATAIGSIALPTFG